MISPWFALSLTNITYWHNYVNITKQHIAHRAQILYIFSFLGGFVTTSIITCNHSSYCSLVPCSNNRIFMFYTFPSGCELEKASVAPPRLPILQFCIRDQPVNHYCECVNFGIVQICKLSTFGTDACMHRITYFVWMTSRTVNIRDLYIYDDKCISGLFIMSFLNRMFQLGWNVFLCSEYFLLLKLCFLGQLWLFNKKRILGMGTLRKS